MKYVQVKTRDSFESWTIDRPDRQNALGPTLAFELLEKTKDIFRRTEVLTRPDTNPSSASPRGLLITAKPVQSSRSRTWIAGGDLKELAALNISEVRETIVAMNEVCALLEYLPIPVVMLLDGSAIGGGAEFFLAGDIRLSTVESQLEFRQLKVGLPCGYGGTRRLVRLIGRAHAQRILMESATIKPHEAHDLGLIHKILSDGNEAEDHISKLMEKWSKVSPQALAIQKSLLSSASADISDHGIDREIAQFISTWRNPAHSEFINQFMTKKSGPNDHTK